MGEYSSGKYLTKEEIGGKLDLFMDKKSTAIEAERNENAGLLHLLYKMGLVVVECDDKKYYLMDVFSRRYSDEKTLDEITVLFDAIKMNMQKYLDENVLHYTKE